MSDQAKLYLNTVMAAGVVMFVDGLVPWRFVDPAQFFAYLILAAMAATLRFQLPGMPPNDSLLFLIILIGVADLPLPQTLVIGAAALAVQRLWKPGEYQKGVRLVLLDMATCAISTVLATDIAHMPWFEARGNPGLTVLVGTLVFLFTNTGLLAGATSLQDNTPLRNLARSWIIGALPYYLAGGAVAASASSLRGWVDWKSVLALLAPAFVIYVYYAHYVEERQNS